MKTITVRDLCQRWPRAEALLEREKEIIVTRDGKPVAKLVRVRELEIAPKRFNPRRHAHRRPPGARGRRFACSTSTVAHCSNSSGKSRRATLAEFRATDPFRFRPFPGSVFETAFRQHVGAGRTHCRTLDRLHLAAMTELDVARLMTHDVAQAWAARALGFEVVTPGPRAT